MGPESPTDAEGTGDSAEAEPEAPATDDDGTSDAAEEGFVPEGFERWRRDSALGNVGTGIARGLQSVFAPPPNQPAIVAAVPGDPPDPERLTVILDPDDPSKSVALLPPPHDASGEHDPPD